MSPDLSRLYRALADDADGQPLADPASLRDRADRRARRRATVGMLTAAVLVGAITVGTQLLPGGADRDGGLPAPAETPIPGPTTAAPTSPAPTSAAPTSAGPTGTLPSPDAASATPATPTSVPDRAFFTQPANTRKADPRFVDGEPLPALCGRNPGDASVVQRRTRELVYRYETSPPEYVADGSYRHSIAIHRPGGARAWLDQLRAAVRACPTQQLDGVTSRQRLLDDGSFGDGSVLFELRAPNRNVNGDPTGEEEVRLVRAIRVGDVVTVLWERGWEGTSSRRSQVDDYSRLAVSAIERWLG